MATLIIDKIDETIKNEFKAECVRRGLTMKEVLIRLMQLELDEHFSVVLKSKEKKK